MNGPEASAAAHWLSLALGDLQAARALLESRSPAPPRDAVALAQQAAEKALKSIIVFAGEDPPRTHDLVAVWNRLSRHRPALREPEGLDELSDAAQAARYPGPRERVFEPAAAHGLVASAEAIIDLVLTALRDEGLDVAGIEPA